MLQDHIYDAHCSRSIFAICPWILSVFCKNVPAGACLTNLKYSSKYGWTISRGQNLKKATRPAYTSTVLILNSVQGTGYAFRSCWKQIDCKQDYYLNSSQTVR